MGPQNLLDSATELLREVLRFAAPADAVVAQYFRAHRAAGPKDRALLTQAVFDVVRRKSQWQHLAQSGTGPLERRLAILAWPGSPDVLDPALSDDERQWLARARQVDLSQLAEPLRHNMPMWLAQTLKSEVPDNGFWPLVESLAQPAALDLRVNLLKAKRAEIQKQLAASGILSKPTTYSPWGLRLEGKPQLQRTSAFTSGAVEFQDEGSQLLALLTGAARGETVVDFCAGAGGKTLALGAMMRNTGRLYAFDVAAHRLEALKPRLQRSGLTNAYLAAIAHENDERLLRLAGKADRVLVDAPCSGLGTLRRSPDLQWRQSESTVSDMQIRQRAILTSAASLLRSGGRLVYATCSLLRAENEQIAEAFEEVHRASFQRLDVADLFPSLSPPAVPVSDRSGFLRIWPHLHGTDGFFAAIWQRR